MGKRKKLTPEKVQLQNIIKECDRIEARGQMYGDVALDLQHENKPEFAAAIAYLQGREHALEYAARMIMDIVTGDDCPF